MMMFLAMFFLQLHIFVIFDTMLTLSIIGSIHMSDMLKMTWLGDRWPKRMVFLKKINFKFLKEILDLFSNVFCTSRYEFISLPHYPFAHALILYSPLSKQYTFLRTRPNKKMTTRLVSETLGAGAFLKIYKTSNNQK